MSDRSVNVIRRTRPRMGLAAIAVLAIAIAMGGRALLADLASRAIADRWLLVVAPVLAYEVGFLGYQLRRLGLEGFGGLLSIGVPNFVTMVRGKLYAATAGFLLVPPDLPLLAWMPGICYGLGAALDWVDGAVARRFDWTSEVGESLDLAFDTLGFLVAPLVGVVWGRLPVFYLSLSAARYLFLAGTWWRQRRGRPVFDLRASRVRRWLAGLQMGFISLALFPILPARVVHPVAAVVLAPSLALFLRDYLDISGRLDSTES